MSTLFIGMTLSVIGKGLIALGVVWVHITMATERSIDEEVIRSFRTETIITVIGFLMIVVGYVLEIQAFGGFEAIINCTEECSAAVFGAVR